MNKINMCLTIVLAAVLLLTPVSALAESRADFLFNDSEEFYEPDIPNGPWIYHSQNLTICIKKTYEFKQLCYIADIYIRNNETPYTGWAKMKPPGLSTELPHRIARRYDAVFALTGDYICHPRNKKGVMIRDGEVYYDKQDADVLAVLPSGEMDVHLKGTITADELIEQGIKDTLAFGPILVLNGEMTEAVSKHRLKPPNVRTGIGKVEDGHYIAIVSRGKFTFKQYAQLFMSYGCVWAYNLDGGQSAAMAIMGEQVNAHSLTNLYGDVIVRQRPIPDVLLLGKSELVPDITDKAVYNGSR